MPISCNIEKSKNPCIIFGGFSYVLDEYESDSHAYIGYYIQARWLIEFISYDILGRNFRPYGQIRPFGSVVRFLFIRPSRFGGMGKSPTESSIR